MNENQKIIGAAGRPSDNLDAYLWGQVEFRIPDANELVAPIGENESTADYFCRLLDGSERAAEAKRTHETWKRRHLNGLRQIDCTQRILIVLNDLFESDFLSCDWFDTGIPKADRDEAQKEMDEQGLGELIPIEGAVWKYALLRELRKPQNARIEINESNAGYYISEMHDRLSRDAVESFCRFVTFTRLAYHEIDEMKAGNSDTLLAKCTESMLADIEPLREYVKPEFAGRYDELLAKILCVGHLQQTLKEVSPNGFKGGYNQKLTCNIVGALIQYGIYNLNAKRANELIYTDKTHIKYITDFKPSKSSEPVYSTVLTPAEYIEINNLLKGFM